MDELAVRPAAEGDTESINAVYRYAREFMRANGNGSQWSGGYPDADTVARDIRDGVCYVVEDGEGVCGVFVFCTGGEPCYEKIEGRWKNSGAYGTIHRIAGSGRTKGIFEACLKFCEGKISNIRIDTHRDNLIMRHLIEKNGFEFCGIVHVRGGSPRLAYQKTPAEAEKT